MKQITIDFEIGDKVFIPAIERPGTVRSVWINRNGTQYEVAWFDDGDHKLAYLMFDEIKPAQR